MEKVFLNINGLNAKVLKFENKNNNNSILILHGWGGKSESWIKFSELLFNEGFNVYVPDLPGFGETTLPYAFTLNDYSTFVNFLIEELKLDDFMLFGHSNGGSISLKLAYMFPNLNIQKLILNNSAGVRNIISMNFKRKILKNISFCFKIFKYFPGYNFFRINFYKILGNYDYVNSLKKPYLEKTYKNIIGEDLQELMKNIDLKTLLLRGEKDTFTPISYGKIFNENIKNSRFIIIKNEGHSIHLKNPIILFQKFLNNIY